ncbi:MAG: hypothetical protein AAFO95_08355 [Cyanobacteria bacterium J06600_6]
MKAIVANVLFGGILGCLSCASSTRANPLVSESSPVKSIVSANVPIQSQAADAPQLFNLIGNAFASNSLYGGHAALSVGYHQWLKRSPSIGFEPASADYLPQSILLETDCSLGFCSDGIGDRSGGTADQLLSSQKQYIHRDSSADVVLGFQNTFWPSERRGKYWGITTIEHWGESSGQGFDLHKLNYAESAPILAAGSSALTFSGGGSRNLAKRAVLNRNVNSDREFENFRGGITYHQGLAKELTLGFGFVYEDIFSGFSQLTYKSNILPITTTVSFVAKKTNANLHSHIRFQPSNSFALNYYHDGKEQQADASWGVYPGLTLIARGNSKQKTYSAGIKVAVQNDYFSLTATAALDRERNLQWNLNSQIGNFKLVHSSNKNKTSSELSNQLIDSESFGIQCSAFIKYQTRLVKQQQQEFVVWGGKIQSQSQVKHGREKWNLDLAYGTSSHGKGWIANGSIALQPDLFFKLNYQEISPVSDETRIKLELGSR